MTETGNSGWESFRVNGDEIPAPLFAAAGTLAALATHCTAMVEKRGDKAKNPEHES
jgi:hypothetical protein